MSFRPIEQLSHFQRALHEAHLLGAGLLVWIEVAQGDGGKGRRVENELNVNDFLVPLVLGDDVVGLRKEDTQHDLNVGEDIMKRM